MNYVYDIYLNFHKTYYDFYEWYYDDNLSHIKKIPIIRVNSNLFKKIISHNIALDNNFFKTIQNKTESYGKINKISGLIITDTKNLIAIRFNNKGISIERSALLVEDELDVLQFSLKNKEITPQFKFLSKIVYPLVTRKEEKYPMTPLNIFIMNVLIKKRKTLTR